MAVQAVYFSDKDGLDMALKHPDTLLFTNKADADARDKVLELSEEIREFLVRNVDGLDEETADRCALSIAENRELFQKALRRPHLLNADADSAE